MKFEEGCHCGTAVGLYMDHGKLLPSSLPSGSEYGRLCRKLRPRPTCAATLCCPTGFGDLES